jgi:hypothetical protein
MALMGKIDDFGIVEIFQLISQQQRSGILTIENNGKKAHIFFSNGMISKACPFYLSPKKEPFGDAAFKARFVTEEQLQRVLGTQKEQLKNIEEIFLDMNLLSSSQIQKINAYLLVETLFDVLQWKSGEYEFSLKEIEHDKRVSALVPTEHILLDSLRMIDEEPELYQKIPHMGIVFQKKILDETLLAGIDELTINEKIVFRSIDGIKNVQDIICQNLLCRYDTLKALHRLLAGNFIKKIAVTKTLSLKPQIKRNHWQYVLYGVFPVVFVLFLFGLRTLLHPSLRHDITSCKKIFAKTQSQKIKNALNVYFLKIGKYPERLKDLVAAGLLKKDDLGYFEEDVFFYHLQADGSYRLDDVP